MLKKLIYIWLFGQLYFTTYYYQLNDPIRIIINITMDRILLLGIVIYHLKLLLNKKEITKKLLSIEYLMIFFGLVCTFSMILSGANSDQTHGANRWASTLILFIFMPTYFHYLSRQVLSHKNDIEKLLFAVVFIGLYLGITGIFEHYRIDQLVFPSYIMDKSLGLHWDRARGPFLNSGINGRLIIFGLLSTLFLIKNSNSKYKILLYFAALPMLCTIYFTYTRGVWLGFVAALIPMIAFNKKFRKYSIIFIIFISIGIISGSMSKLSLNENNVFETRTTTIDDRLNLMVAAFRMFEAKPFFGWGYGRFNFISPDFFIKLENVELRGEGEGNHNTFLGLLAEVGLIGFFPYLFVLFLFFKKSLYIIKSENDVFYKDFGLLFLSCLSAYIITMQSGDVRWNMLQNTIIFMYGGILIQLGKGLRKNVLS